MPMSGRIRFYATETLLWLAAAVGLIAMVLVFCAYFFNISIILFRTGSMEPAIPAGSAALVREIEAAEVTVGDVLTVDRPGEMPVTHRVTSVEPGNAVGERVITMQGDANDSPDPEPYTITEGRVVLRSVPGLANTINQMGNPYLMGGVTVAASVLVGWAFWPKRASGNTGSKDENTRPRRSSKQSQRPRHAGSTALGLAAVASVAVVGLTPGEANASIPSPTVEETFSSTYITLTSVYDPSTRQSLGPNDMSEWDVGIAVEGPTKGQARAGLSATGNLPLNVTVLSCSARWDNDPAVGGSSAEECSGASRIVATDLLIAPEHDVQWIDDFSTEDTPWLRLVVSLASEEAPTASAASLHVHAEAWGEEVSTRPDERPDDREDVSADDSRPPAAKTPGSEEYVDQNGDLARTGFSLMVVAVAAVLSVLTGRWMTRRYKRRDRVCDLAASPESFQRGKS